MTSSPPLDVVILEKVEMLVIVGLKALLARLLPVLSVPKRSKIVFGGLFEDLLSSAHFATSRLGFI